ncbi:MAG: EcsC family protein [Deltaproteobacteria bacterium]|nr:EcsC family protein [Deltaproteobacteria bacterium]
MNASRKTSTSGTKHAPETKKASPAAHAHAQRLSAEDESFVRAAAAFLERPSFLIRVADLVGRPVEAALDKLPQSAQRLVARAVDGALARGLDWASGGLGAAPLEIASVSAAGTRARGRGRRMSLVAAASGAVGGFAGIAVLPLELPVSTLILLRSIAATAHEMGADLNDPITRLECLSVLSLGSPSRSDDAAEVGYWATRVGLASAVREAARVAAKVGADDLTRIAFDRTAPALLRLVGMIAGRFEAVVTERALAQLLPVVGALSGAVVNTAFAQHFHTVALYHFGLRRLERQHGGVIVEERYRAAHRALHHAPARALLGAGH